MKVDAGLDRGGPRRGAGARPRARGAGLRRLRHGRDLDDPFLPLLLAAEHTQRLELMTSIAVAFARSPMTLANLGHDLNAYSKGRFILGLGSQIQPHITKRFSMPWSHPAARMRELIQAMRAIWALLVRGREARLPRRVLHAHADDADVHAHQHEVRRAEGAAGRGGPADDRGRRRGGGRHDRPRLHHAALPPRGHAAGDRARPREGRPRAEELPARLPRVRGHGPRREGMGAEPRRSLQADRLLRLDAGLPAACSSRTAGARSRASSTR